MASLDELKAKAIEDLGKGSSKVQDIIEAKNNALNRLTNHNQGKADYSSPQLTPYDDLSFPKSKDFQINTPEQVETRYQQLEADYNQQIRDALEETIQERDIGHMQDLIDQLDNKDLCMVVEEGREAYKRQDFEKTQTREQEHNKSIEESLEFNMDEFEQKIQDYPIYSDFNDNSKDMDADIEPPEPSQDFE